jgi:hypothetical protein
LNPTSSIATQMQGLKEPTTKLRYSNDALMATGIYVDLHREYGLSAKPRNTAKNYDRGMSSTLGGEELQTCKNGIIR